MKKLTDRVNNFMGITSGIAFISANIANLVVGTINGGRNVSGQIEVFPFTYLCALTGASAGITFFSAYEDECSLKERLKTGAYMALGSAAIIAPIQYGAGYFIGNVINL